MQHEGFALDIILCVVDTVERQHSTLAEIDDREASSHGVASHDRFVKTEVKTDRL